MMGCCLYKLCPEEGLVVSLARRPKDHRADSKGEGISMRSLTKHQIKLAIDALMTLSRSLWVCRSYEMAKNSVEKRKGTIS